MQKTDGIVEKGVHHLHWPSYRPHRDHAEFWTLCRCFTVAIKLLFEVAKEKQLKHRVEQYSWAGGNAVKVAASAIKILLIHFTSCCTGGFDAFLSRCSNRSLH